MTTCENTDGAERTVIDAGLGFDPGLGEITTELVRDTEDDPAPRWSARSDLDTYGAAVRGLAQYLGQLDALALGRRLRFTRVTEHAPDTTDEATPAPYLAILGSEDAGRYTGPPMAPTAIKGTDREPVVFIDPADDRYMLGLFDVASYTHDRLVAKIWADNEPERAALVREVERMAWPSLGHGGFRLRLAHYHGAIAKYTLRTGARENEVADLLANRSIAALSFSVTLPQLRTHRRPRVDVRGTITAAVPR